ncbi:MAG: DUF4340 domain-containing protein [Armatimonadia bacterium]
MKRHSRLIVTGLIFVVLLGWVLTQERGRKVEKGEAFGIDAKTATKLQVKSLTTSLTLEKAGDQWWITEPVRGWADKDAAERMINAMAQLKPTGSRKENPADPKYGLDKPGLTATLTHGGKQSVIYFGAQLTGGSEYYARIDARNKLYFVPTSLYTDLTQPTDSLRDKALTHLKKEDVVAVTLQYPDRALTLEKRGTAEKPQWLLTAPYEAKADEWSVKQVVDKLADMKADDFAPEKPAAGQSYGLEKPVLKATLRTKDGKQSIVNFGAKGQQPGDATKEINYVQVEGRPEVLLVAYSNMADLQKTDMDLRDKRMLEFEKNDVSEIRVERKQGVSFTARRTGPDRWALATPITAPAENNKINDLLWDLNELEAKEFLGEQKELAPYGLSIPETIFTLTVKGQKEPIKVFVGYKKAEGVYYARTSQGNQVYVIADMLLQDLPKKVDELKEAKPAGGAAPVTPAFPTPPAS